MSIILIGGGSRSGKSRHALDLARKSGGRMAFIATAQPGDEEMRDRIRRHREERGQEFTTIEEPVAVSSRLIADAGRFDIFVVDCLTIWLSNLLLEGHDIPRQSKLLIEAAVEIRSRVVLVTNEVGCGIVPENALARQYRDLAGRLNQDAAAAADEVYWMIFGVPLKVK